MELIPAGQEDEYVGHQFISTVTHRDTFTFASYRQFSPYGSDRVEFIATNSQKFSKGVPQAVSE